MPRTSVEEVRKIIDTDQSDTNLTSFLTSANAFVSALFASSNLPDALLTEIEKWITAHFIASTVDQQVATIEGGGSRIVFQGNTGRRFESTHYGQNAVMLDPTGLLSKATDKDLKRTYFGVVEGV